MCAYAMNPPSSSGRIATTLLLSGSIRGTDVPSSVPTGSHVALVFGLPRRIRTVLTLGLCVALPPCDSEGCGRRSTAQRRPRRTGSAGCAPATACLAPYLRGLNQFPFRRLARAGGLTRTPRVGSAAAVDPYRLQARRDGCFA